MDLHRRQAAVRSGHVGAVQPPQEPSRLRLLEAADLAAPWAGRRTDRRSLSIWPALVVPRRFITWPVARTPSPRGLSHGDVARRAGPPQRRSLPRGDGEPYLTMREGRDEDVRFMLDQPTWSWRRWPTTALEVMLQTIGQIAAHHLLGHADPRNDREDRGRPRRRRHGRGRLTSQGGQRDAAVHRGDDRDARATTGAWMPMSSSTGGIGGLARLKVRRTADMQPPHQDEPLLAARLVAGAVTKGGPASLSAALTPLVANDAMYSPR